MPEVTVFYGLYGSGKTEIAINYALRLSQKGTGVTIVDLDAVTPYFRVRDVRDYLVARGVAVVAPKESVRHADLPVLPEGVRGTLRGAKDAVVVDVGGDPTGARVLGGLKDSLPEDAKGLFVVNSSRPFSRTVSEAESAVKKIADSTGLRPFGLVSNTHMAEYTTVEHIARGVAFTRELGLNLGLPVVFCAAPEALKPSEDEISQRVDGLCVLWLRRFLVKPWEQDDV